MPSLLTPPTPVDRWAVSSARPGQRRIVPAALIALLLGLLALSVLAPTPAFAAPPRTVTVLDTTDSVDDEALAAELDGVEFRSEVDLVVMTLDVSAHGYSAAEDTALNSAVRDEARAEHPELLSEDAERFADGTVIIALDPDNRFLGTYAGDDVALGEGGFSTVQDAMRDEAESGEWGAALRTGAEKYADLLGRPWWQAPGALVAGFVVLGGAVAGVLGMLGLRRAARRRMDETLPRFQDVLAKRAMTDSAARRLPEHSPYAQAARRDHEEYGQKIIQAQQLHEQLPAASQRPWSWGLRSGHRVLARDVERTVGFLDDTDDAIIAAADLLQRSGRWREAWERELDPLRDSVAALDSVLEDRAEMTTQEERAATDLVRLGDGISTELDELTTQLQQDRIDVDSALERLDALTGELSAAVSRLQQLHIARLAEDGDEEEVLREAAGDVVDEEYLSLRARRHRMEHLGAGSTFWHLSPVLWYSSWHHTSSSALETHRSPSASGSTAGYSGGGFSGAGSSSRF